MSVEPARISLREITAETVIAITRLAVADSQKGFVAPNAISLAQALFAPEAWYRAIYLDDTPVGLLGLVIEQLRSRKRFAKLELSYVPGPGCPEPFYLGLGFRHTGRVDGQEVVLELPLTDPAM